MSGFLPSGDRIGCAALVLAALACEGPPPPSASSNTPLSSRRGPQASPSDKAAPDAASLAMIPDVVASALPAVVGVSTIREVELPEPFDDPFGYPFEPDRPAPDQRGFGSGVIVSKDGLVLTNYHVINGADAIEVTLFNEDNYAARAVGTDMDTDLAVLQIVSPPDSLRPLPFGDSDALRLGESAVAIGNPFGLSSTVTLGIISAVGRGNVGVAEYEDFIQTDAAINPGNSGGALVDLRGKLIGINTAILSRTGGYEGVGFAIPSAMARSIMRALVDDGRVRRGYLGVRIQTLEPDLAESLELPRHRRGVVVSQVQESSPAQRAGLERGDVITQIGSKSISSANDLRNTIALLAPGSPQDFKIIRRGRVHRVEIVLGELPGASSSQAAPPTSGPDESPSSSPVPPTSNAGSKGLEGVILTPLSSRLRTRFGISTSLEAGILVVGVAPGSVASRAGLRPGDVILQLNHNPIQTLHELRDRVEASSARYALLLVWRSGHSLFVPLPLTR